MSWATALRVLLLKGRDSDVRVGGLFDGVGLLAYGLHLAGLEHAWLCEWDPWRRDILRKRFPGVPVYDDVRHVGAANAVRVDVIAGGFPCKGASTAGKLNGFDHPETVLWREMFRAVRELRPKYVVIENVANLLALHDGAVWGEVLGDLASIGYDITWDCVPAAAVGAPHLRDRLFAVATYADGAGEQRDAGQRGEQDGRADARGADQDASDSGRFGRPGEGRRRGVEREERTAGAHGQAPAHADRDGVRQQPVSKPGSGRAAVIGRAGEATADTAREGREPAEPEDEQRGLRSDTRAARAVAVEWGEYAAAIRRWEELHGPAPEPLVRRMDDRAAARVERSRLSALGDGVQVQVGYLVARHIIELEEGGVTA